MVAMSGLRRVPKDQRISRELGERVFLAVIGVNDCAYCSWLHTRTALAAGLTDAEITSMLAGDFSELSEDEAVAVLYAQHWADSQGAVSPEARQRALEEYGPHTLRHIEAHITAVNFGNLCSNTVVSYEDGTLPGRDRVATKLTYVLSKPVAAGIRFASSEEALSVAGGDADRATGQRPRPVQGGRRTMSQISRRPSRRYRDREASQVRRTLPGHP